MIKSQVFENQKHRDRVQKSMSKSRTIFPPYEISANNPDEHRQLDPPSPRLFQKLDMLSLSKASKHENPFEFNTKMEDIFKKDSKSCISAARFNKESVAERLPIPKDISYSAFNPFIESTNEGEMRRSPGLGMPEGIPCDKKQNLNYAKGPIKSLTDFHEGLSKYNYESQPSSIELLAHETDHDASSSESSTKSFSSYIPGASVQNNRVMPRHGAIAEKRYQQPANVWQSSDELVIARQESPKIR